MSSTGLFDEPKSAGVGAPVPESPILGDMELQKALSAINRAEPLCSKWKLKEDKVCRRFFAGKQLSEEDEQALRDEQRPANAFNTAQKFIRYVSGVMRDCPTQLLYNALTLENDAAQLYGDQLGKYYDWAISKSGGTIERATAFEDFLISGMGWTNSFIDRTQDPRGLIGYERIPGKEMIWPMCGKVNLGGSRQGTTRFRAWERVVNKEEAKFMFRGSTARMLIEDDGDADSMFMGWQQVDRVPYKIPYVQTYDINKLGGSKGTKKHECKIMEYQWWDNIPGYLFLDPGDDTQQWMNEEEFSAYSAALKDMGLPEIEDYDPQMGREWKRMFILNRRYKLEPSSKLPGERFTFNAMCCHWDEEDTIWYGFFRALMDPQKYLNKFFNQMIEIIGKQAKGGAMFEEDAFEDDAAREAFLDEYAITGSVQRLASGGLAKVKEKALPQVAAGTVQMVDFCLKSMEQVTGISENSLGLGAGTQPGIAMQRRQRAGMVLLASEFDAEAEFRKEEGYIIYDYLKLLAESGGEDRLIRLASFPGQPPGEVVPLTSEPFELDYDIELDETERDPNMRMFLADLLVGPLGQMLQKAGMFTPEFLDVLPIPRSWVLKIKKSMEEKAKKAQEDQAKGIAVAGTKGKVKPLIELQALVKNKDADTMLKQARAMELTAKAKKLGQPDPKDAIEIEQMKRGQSHEDIQGVMQSMAAYQQLVRERQKTQKDQASQAVDLARKIGGGQD